MGWQMNFLRPGLAAVGGHRLNPFGPRNVLSLMCVSVTDERVRVQWSSALDTHCARRVLTEGWLEETRGESRS